MAPDKSDGLRALLAAAEPVPGIHALRLNGVLRLMLTPKEAAQVTGVKYRDVLAAINAGRVRVIGRRRYRIPVGELDAIIGWAELAAIRREFRTGRR